MSFLHNNSQHMYILHWKCDFVAKPPTNNANLYIKTAITSHAFVTLDTSYASKAWKIPMNNDPNETKSLMFCSKHAHLKNT